MIIKKLPIAQRIFLHGALLNECILPSCTTCSLSEHKPSSVRAVDVFCTKYNAFPPLDVLLVGCEQWAEDDIPF